jgi:hypothetical protein
VLATPSAAIPPPEQLVCDITGLDLASDRESVEVRVLPARLSDHFVRGELFALGTAIEDCRANSWLNAFFTVSLVTLGGRGRKGLTRLFSLFLDLDFKILPRDRAQELLRDFPLIPSAIIASGGGWHVYWFLLAPILFPDGFERARSLLRRLAIRLEADLAAAEPARILRLPATMNRKYEPDRLVECVYYNPAKYPIEQFEDVLRDVKDERKHRDNGCETPASDALDFTPQCNTSCSRPGDDFNARAPWAGILEPNGWRLVHECDGTAYWRRPGKTEGQSASTNHGGSGLLYVFSSSAAPFEAGRAYSKFGAFALLEHGGDFRSAAKRLAGWRFGG